MLAVQGYFEAGRFVSSKTVKIPEHRPVIVVVPDEQAPKDDNAEAWRKFLDALQFIEEDEPIGFERATLHREAEI